MWEWGRRRSPGWFISDLSARQVVPFTEGGNRGDRVFWETMSMNSTHQVWGVGDTFRSRHFKIWSRDSDWKDIWIWRPCKQMIYRPEGPGDSRQQAQLQIFEHCDGMGVGGWFSQSLKEAWSVSQNEFRQNDWDETRGTLLWVCGSPLPGCEHKGQTDGQCASWNHTCPKLDHQVHLWKSSACSLRSHVLAGMSLGHLELLSVCLGFPRPLSGSLCFPHLPDPLCKREGSFSGRSVCASFQRNGSSVSGLDFLNQDDNLLKPEKAIPLFTECTF